MITQSSNLRILIEDPRMVLAMVYVDESSDSGEVSADCLEDLIGYLFAISNSVFHILKGQEQIIL